jgi:hypothetical protein
LNQEKSKMKKYVMALAVAVVSCILLGFFSNALAADANQPKVTPKEAAKEKQTIIGTVHEVKDKDGNVTQVTLNVSKTVIYQITLDTKGKDLGRTMDGKRVKAVGEPKVQGSVRWLTVDKYEEQAKPQPKPKPQPQPKPGQKPSTPKY